MKRNLLAGLVPVLFHRLSAVCLLAVIMAAGPAIAASTLPDGTKTITLVAHDGTKQAIGSVTFTPDAGGAKIAVALDAPEFSEEFLSMRPFRCLPNKKEMWCHLAYPYATKGHITAGDLADLEYSILFLFKPPAGYGIDAWNGLYFKLSLEDDGSLSGKLHETDFNPLGVPPESGNLRPIDPKSLTPVATDAHRFGRVEIR